MHPEAQCATAIHCMQMLNLQSTCAARCHTVVDSRSAATCSTNTAMAPNLTILVGLNVCPET
ncbi:uncharacterized protein RCC_07423 [Ramularia collo-cygni]|uniref:Uncharacterized protein n=1 Tax=Ramularia collo-cygni TaxID=112498 RepID=A0A2D3UXI8_9PEZI|nr:uncharacterized protein RCC_07423 [Ramularia collo-cygni]CZT21561.1 uncharacterized protein RCC_07423 [Ramularia collo-cygni]